MRAGARSYASCVDDLQRPPSDGDRERVATRVRRVYDEGRIGAADRDIRLANVRSAQSMAELDLMTRELDQLETALGASAGPAPYGAFDPKAAKRSRDVTASGGPGRLVAIIGVVVAVVLLVGAVVAVLGNRIAGSLDDGPSSSPGAAANPAADPGADPGSADLPAGAAYSAEKVGKLPGTWRR